MKNKNYKKIMLLGLLVLFVLSFVRFLDNSDLWIVDIISHFPVQYAFLSFLFMAICLRKKSIIMAFAALFLFLVNASELLDTGGHVQAREHNDSTFQVFSANINVFNNDVTKLKKEILEKNAEIVLLLEMSPQHVKKMGSFIQSYPFHVEYSPIGTHNLGIVLLSKFPILDHNLTKLSKFGSAVLDVILEVNNRKLKFYGAHLQPPVDVRNFSDRTQQFINLAHEICKTEMPIIVAGDFNATPFSPIFRKFKKISGLKDSRTGFGWQPSWPTLMPVFWIPIDHILVSSDIYVHNRATGSYIGSDHYPVFAELSIL